MRRDNTDPTPAPPLDGRGAATAGERAVWHSPPKGTNWRGGTTSPHSPLSEGEGERLHSPADSPPSPVGEGARG